MEVDQSVKLPLTKEESRQNVSTVRSLVSRYKRNNPPKTFAVRLIDDEEWTGIGIWRTLDEAWIRSVKKQHLSYSKNIKNFFSVNVLLPAILGNYCKKKNKCTGNPQYPCPLWSCGGSQHNQGQNNHTLLSAFWW